MVGLLCLLLDKTLLSSKMVLIIDFLSACATIYHIFISDANIGKCNGGSKALPAIFLKIEKNFRNFKKKYPDCVDLWVKYFIRNAVLRASRREKSRIFPLGLLNWCAGVVDKMFVKAPSFQEILSALENPSLRPCICIYHVKQHQRCSHMFYIWIKQFIEACSWPCQTSNGPIIWEKLVHFQPYQN